MDDNVIVSTEKPLKATILLTPHTFSKRNCTKRTNVSYTAVCQKAHVELNQHSTVQKDQA